MLVRELIEKLKECDQETEVRLLTDHGQCCMRVNGVDHGFIEDNGYMPAEVHEDDADEDNPEVVILSAF